MAFGQLVIGPPGSGKTTYCMGMAQFMRSTGRKVAIVNLDPANDVLPYTPDVDISDLVNLENVMQELQLGPNGGLVYCIDYLKENLDWLKEALDPLERGGAYILFDLPGQVELFMMHDSLRAITQTFANTWGYRLVAVQLVDAHLCTDASKYVSALMLSLSTMLHLELPHVNVLSKIDLVRQYGKLDFNLEFYTEVQDLGYLVRTMGNSPFTQKYRKLSAGLCELVQDFSLVSFVPLAIQDQEAVAHLLGIIDKANGYVFASLASGQSPYPPEFVYGSTVKGSETDLWSTMEERYIQGKGGAGGSGIASRISEHQPHTSTTKQGASGQQQQPQHTSATTASQQGGSAQQQQQQQQQQLHKSTSHAPQQSTSAEQPQGKQQQRSSVEPGLAGSSGDAAGQIHGSRGDDEKG